jgi:hypothetical protein
MIQRIYIPVPYGKELSWGGGMLHLSAIVKKHKPLEICIMAFIEELLINVIIMM